MRLNVEEHYSINGWCNRCGGLGMEHIPHVDLKRSMYEAREQALPKATPGPAIHDLVSEDIQERKRVGIQRYGQPLQAFNGRDVLKDIYEELLDAACYVRQLMEERKNDDKQ